MGLNVTVLAARIAGVTLTLEKAETIIATAIDLIDTAEQLYEGLAGPDKLATVEAGLATIVKDLAPQVDFAALWTKLAPLVSMVVTVFNLKNAWPFKSKPTPKPDSSGQTVFGGGSASQTPQ